MSMSCIFEYVYVLIHLYAVRVLGVFSGGKSSSVNEPVMAVKLAHF